MEPITRSEMLMDGQYVEPITRKEKILAGDDSEPVTREEYFLKKYRHSGGDVDVVQLTATENKTYTAPEGKAYNPVKVNVPEKQLIGLYADENKTYRPSTGYDGFSEVTVDVPTPPPSLQSLTASHNGYFVPSSGYEGFSEVTVNVPLPNNAYLLESQNNDVVTIQHGAEFDMPKLIASIEPQQSGSGDPSPTNIRPISGWTACNVVRTGKNLFDKTAITDNVYLSTTTGLTESNSDYCVSDYIKVKANETIYMPNSNSARRWFYDSNKTPKTYLNGATTYTPTEDGYIRVTLNKLGTSAIDLNTYQIEFGSSATTYEEYSGDTYTINFVDGSSPLTVYKGEFDVLSGSLKVYPHYDSYNGETINGEWISDRDVYAEGTTPTIGAEVQVMSGSDYTTYQQVANNIKSLEGVNNIWADTGEVDVQIWTKEV